MKLEAFWVPTVSLFLLPSFSRRRRNAILYNPFIGLRFLLCVEVKVVKGRGVSMANNSNNAVSSQY